MIQTRHIPFICAISLLFCACGGIDQRPVQVEQPEWLSLPLPDMPHVVSDTSVIIGSDHDVTGGLVTDESHVATIGAQEENASWALYSFGLTECTLSNIALDVENVSGEYWVGLADYGRNRWEWHGPFTDDTEVAPWGDPDDYLSPADNVHWVVVAPRDSSLQVISSTVEYSVDNIFHVPPAGLQTVAADPALYPSLILMSENTPRAETGAPVIFYLGVDGANTYYAYYDGEAWQHKLALPDGPVITHPVARGFPAFGGGTEVLLAGYDVADGKPKLYWLDKALAQFPWPIEPPSTGSGVLSMLAMDCIDADNWVLAEARTNGDDTVITANYDDNWDDGKPVYSDEIVGEQVVGLDALFGSGEPIIAYSHGTIDTSSTILLDFSVTLAEGASTWSVFTADNDSPLSLDLGQDSDGILQMLFVAGRDFEIPFPSFKATLYYDVVVGSYIDESWDFVEVFEGTLSGYILSGSMQPDWGVNASWAGADALSYSRIDGTIGFTMSPEFAITGGELFNHVQLKERSGGSFVDGPEHTATPGVGFSWAEGPSGLSCAYIRAEQVDIDEVLGGQLAASGDLLYWSSWQ
jgi:hypothetical protein